MENSNWRFGMTDKNTAGIDLDSLEAAFNARPDVPSVIVGRDLLAKLFDLARRAEPSVAAGDERIEAWLYICKKPGEGRTYASVDENDAHHWPLDQWTSVEKIPLVRAALASPAVNQMEPLREFSAKLAASQKPLDPEIAQVLHANMFDLYASDEPAVSQKAVPVVPSGDARDAARYRWLTESPGYIRPHLNGQAVYVNWSGTKQALDTAIDQAIASSAAQEAK
jgi:hypothetical protein